jgi:hypothetical protein
MVRHLSSEKLNLRKDIIICQYSNSGAIRRSLPEFIVHRRFEVISLTRFSRSATCRLELIPHGS